MTVELIVKGMSCGGCVRSVTRAVQRLDPTSQVDVELETGRVHIEGGMSPEQVRQAIETAGYAAELAPSDG
ncbi:MAG: heavy-metal-associated domain-containing protein [Polyangiaceae bacterium]|nr:heavy-metal-associated domain-containing protein [Polyangiaceae bacterium]